MVTLSRFTVPGRTPLYRPHHLPFVFDQVEVVELQYVRPGGGGERVFFEDVPADELSVVQGGEGEEFLDGLGAVLRSFAETDRSELRKRADGVPLPFFGRGKCPPSSRWPRTHAWQQNSQFSARWADRRRLPHEDLDTAYADGPASSEFQARNGQLQSLSRHRPNLSAGPSWNRPFS